MDLRQYLRVLRRRWWLITLCAVVVLGASAGFAWLQTPKYAAHVKLFVSTRAGGDPTATFNGGQFAQARVKSYADILSSDLVVGAVKRQLQLPESVADLQKKITASAPLDTVVIDVTVTDTDPTRARDIAAAVGNQFTLPADQLETPQGQRLSAVKVTVVEPASLPGSPVSPDKTLFLALGLLVGLVVGVGAAVLWAALDSTVSDRDEAAELTAAPVLGALPSERKANGAPVVATGDYFAPLAEAFRQLRTNLRFLGPERTRSLVVTSAADGDGKTTVAVNLAITLAQSGETVVLIDADLRSPDVARSLGVVSSVGLSELLSGYAELDEVLQPWPGNPALRVVTSGALPPNPSELVGSQRMRDVLDELARRSVVVVLDSPSLIPATDAAVLGNFADATLLVARPGKTRRESLESAAEALRQAGGQLVGVVLNQVVTRRGGRKSKPGPGTAQPVQTPGAMGGYPVGTGADSPPRRLLTEKG